MITIEDKKKCCGCSACVQRCPKQCISLQEDEEGFLYPQVDKEICVNCGLCEKVCPVINPVKARKPQVVYAARAIDEKVRLESSSGGVFTVLAEQVIERGGVVFGAKFNEQWEVVHAYTESKEGLFVFRGSKYVQSKIGISYVQAENFLKAGRVVLFSGTPCQIAGLKLYLRKEYANLLTVDFVCHGVPSPMVWKDYLNGKIRPLGVVGKNMVSSLSLKAMPVITGISFRDKRNGWKKYGFAVHGVSASKADKNLVSPSVEVQHKTLLYEPYRENVFMIGFLKNLYLRPSCYVCPAKCGRGNSDYTLADFWGAKDFIPEFDDDKGLSALLVYTDRLRLSKEKIQLKKISLQDVLAQNPAVVKSSKCKDGRANFFEKYAKAKDLESFIMRYSKYSLKETIRYTTIKVLCELHLVELIKKILGR